MTRLINIDNGGTLTDICIVDGSDVRYTKTLTTPFDLSRCLFDGLTKASRLLYDSENLAGLLQGTDYVRYSTTQGTNALVQRTGPQLGLLVTDPTVVEGLAATASQEDLLTALVSTRHAVIDPEPDEASLVATVTELTAAGAGRIVVSIGGADGPELERRIKRLLLRLYPRHLLGAIPLLFSWELAADSDDIRRTWSALLNAFLHPAMERFLFNADRRLREHRTRRPLLIFRNDGGSSRVAKSSAIKTYSSGPRGGLEGTRALARRYGLRHVLMVDVGGTTTDVGVVTDGAVEVNRRGSIESVPTSFELAAISSHGVGGSSVIGAVDGQVTVGPRSVGAAPGPACFGLGGTDATITDVFVLTGLLDPATYLEGTVALDAEAARRAVLATVAEPLGLSLDEALAHMEDAYLERVADVLRDQRPASDTVIAAFGGAGPMTVCGAARLAGVRRVIVPRTAAVFSAFGIGYSDISQHYEHPLGSADPAEIGEVAARLRARGARDMYAEGVDPADCAEALALRISVGDSDVAVPLTGPPPPVPPGATVSLELTLVAPLPHVSSGGDGETLETPAAPAGSRIGLPVFVMVEQSTGATAAGPAIVEGPFFTMRLPEGWTFQITGPGDLLLTDQLTHRSE